MLAPKVARPRTKAAEGSTSRLAPRRSALVGHRLGHDSIEQLLFFQHTIGNQAMLRLLAQQQAPYPIRNGRGDHEQDRSIQENMTAEAPRGPSWDFSKIFPTNHQRSSASLRLQPKFAISAVKDPLEHEADRVAERVMRMPDPAAPTTQASTRLDRKCAACEAQDKKKLQTKPAGTIDAAGREAPPMVHDQPLDPATRDFFEPWFAYDFSGERAHTDEKAAASARRASWHRCESSSTCENDELSSYRDPSGCATCNETTGNVDITVFKEQCAGNCILQHEQTHVVDESGCCQTFSNCISKAADLDGRNKCRANWQAFLDANEHWTECNAYNTEGQCLTSLIRNNCTVSGGPVSEDCCASLQNELNTVSQRASDHCSQSTAPLPCGLFFV